MVEERHMHDRVLYKYESITKKVQLCLWTLALVGYFFQFPFSKLASLITPCIVVYIILEFPNWKIPRNTKYQYVLLIYIVFLLAEIIRSVVNAVPVGRIARFAAILLLLPACCWIKTCRSEEKRKVFIALAVVKSIIIICIAVCVAIQGDFREWRNWAWSNGLGDIYFFNRWMPKVQVQGNALLVMAFIVEILRKRKTTICSVIILVGILVAGNFAYILGAGAFSIFMLGKPLYQKVKSGKISRQTVVIVFVIIIVLTMPYVISKVQQKAETSNLTRYEQVLVLMDTNPLWGKGLGNVVQAVTSTRVYDGDIYFELQTLYIVNQIGFVGLLLAYFLTMYPLFMPPKNRLYIYLIYLLYSFWNPYCWDTTHMITLILIVNLYDWGEENDKGDYYNVLSICRSEIKHFRNLRASR